MTDTPTPIDDGGQIHAEYQYIYHTVGENMQVTSIVPIGGITLREFYAAFSLMGQRAAQGSLNIASSDVARRADDDADAMLAERNRHE
jgi:hypothetical protein